jgi:hypothetical protein
MTLSKNSSQKTLFLSLLGTTLLLSACSSTPEAPKPTVEKAPNAMPAIEMAAVDKAPVPIVDFTIAERIGNLEKDMMTLKNDMASAQPKLQKIDAMERKFRELTIELNDIDTRYKLSQAPAVPTQVISAPLKSDDMTKSPQSPVQKDKVSAVQKPVSGAPAVKQVRFGGKPDRARIVLDMTSATNISYDLDNAEKILVLEIPKTKWDAKTEMAVRSSELVSSYQAENTENGSRLILQLKQPVKVLRSNTLSPSDGMGNRFYIDLGRA